MTAEEHQSTGERRAPLCEACGKRPVIRDGKCPICFPKLPHQRLIAARVYWGFSEEFVVKALLKKKLRWNLQRLRWIEAGGAMQLREQRELCELYHVSWSDIWPTLYT